MTQTATTMGVTDMFKGSAFSMMIAVILLSNALAKADSSDKGWRYVLGDAEATSFSRDASTYAPTGPYQVSWNNSDGSRRSLIGDVNGDSTL